MPEMLRFLYIALREYWVTWVTGTSLVGFGLWLLNMYDRHRVEKGHRPMTMRQNLLVLFCAFWFFATFAAWHDADKNLEAVKRQRAVDTSNLYTCAGDLKAEKARAMLLDGQLQQAQGDVRKQMNATNQQQETMNSQQIAMNSCVVALGKANAPPPLRTVIHSFQADNDPHPKAKHKKMLFVFTNKPMPTPLRFVAGCEKPIKSIDVDIWGGAFQDVAQKDILNDRTVQWQINGPQWTAMNPLVLTIEYDEDNPGRCGLKLQ